VLLNSPHHPQQQVVCQRKHIIEIYVAGSSKLNYCLTISCYQYILLSPYPCTLTSPPHLCCFIGFLNPYTSTLSMAAVAPPPAKAAAAVAGGAPGAVVAAAAKQAAARARSENEIRQHDIQKAIFSGVFNPFVSSLFLS
jgi:hypothetical protein